MQPLLKDVQRCIGSKDLVDLVLLIETSSVEPAEASEAVHRTFARRNSHPIAFELPDPPAIWADEFAALSAEAHLRANRVQDAIGVLREFWHRVVS